MCKLRLSLCLASVLALVACSKPQEAQPLPSSYHPPSVRALTDIDSADEVYEDEPVVVQGVVSAGGQGGWHDDDDDYKVHCFSFDAWREPGKPVLKRYLTILRPVPRDADYSEDFPEYSVQRISVYLSTDGMRAVFEKALRMDSPDDELATIATELQQPVIVSTERFGDLVLDRSMDWFEGETEWNGQAVEVTLPEHDDKPDEDALKTAHALWSDEEKWNQRIEDYAVRELLDLRNDSWREDDDPELTAEAFIARMTLTMVSISYDGGFEFWYDDGEMFGGHTIMVSGTLADGPTDAGIHG